MNPRLAESASPYLRAHAGNPVAWYPWGEEAFEAARRRDVPVMVSIGYSTCHWCHVMARESFEDPETAAVIDDGFVAIKVDREEHPDVDAAYLAAASAFTPNLGWPLTVFTTPDGRPFYAGTYWPREGRSGVPAFRDVLAAVRAAWEARRDEVERTGSAIRDALARAAESGPAASVPLPALVDAARRVVEAEDAEFGGFGDALAPLTTPKFPVVPALRLLQAPTVADAPGAADVVRRALAAMSGSELHDDVEGGFFRYATRRDWTEPHYERMLTDNAGLVDVALDAGDAALVRDVAGFLVGVLQREGGGFGAAQDSESWIDGARSEGGYYRRDAAARAALQTPAVDGKVVTGWNGMAIGALARAGARLGADDLVAAARWAADAVLEVNVRPDGLLARASLDEIPSRALGTLEDYGLLADGLLALALATGEPAYAVRARELVDACVAPDGAVVPGGGDPVLAAQALAAAETSDTDHPSGPAALATAAAALWTAGAGEPYRELAERIVAGRSARALAEPLAHGALLRAAAALAVAPHQVVVIADSADDPLAVAARAIPSDLLAIVTEPQARALAEAGLGLFSRKTALDGRATAYDCRDFACRLPVTDPAALGWA